MKTITLIDRNSRFWYDVVPNTRARKTFAVDYPQSMASLPEHLSAAPVGRKHLSRQVVAQYQRDRVLSAAAEVIARRGYNSTTIDHIVAAAGIGVGTFYDLFANKEDCFLQAYERIVAAAREEISTAILIDRPWAEQACAALGAVLRTIAERPLEARLALVEVQSAGPIALARHEQILDSWVPLLRAGRKSSPLGGGLPATLETAIAGGIVWFLQQRIVMGEIEGIEGLLPELARIVVEPYLGEAEAERFIAPAQAAPPVVG